MHKINYVIKIEDIQKYRIYVSYILTVPFFLEPNIWSSAGFALAEQKQGFGSNIWSNETLLAQLSHMNMPWNANKKLQDQLPDVSVRSQDVFTWIITEGGKIIVNCDGVVSHSTRKVV